MSELQNVSKAAIKKTLTYRYYIYGVVSIAYFLIYFHRTSTAVMAPEIVNTFGITPTAVGFLGSMYFYAYAISQLPAGILADRWGARKTLTLFITVAGLGAILFGMANSFNTILIARFLVGLGAGFIFVPATRILVDWFRKDEFATYVGILTAIGNIGSLASAAPLVFLMAMVGWRNSMTAVGLTSMLVAILLFIFVRNKPYEIGGASISEIEERPAVSATPLGIGESLRIIVGKYNFWAISIMFFVMYGSIMGFQGLWAGPYLMNVYNLTNAQAGNLLILIPIGMIFGCTVAGIAADRLLKSKKKAGMIGIFCYILIWVILILRIDSMSINFIAVLLLLYGFFGGFFTLMSAGVQENLDLRMAGTGIGAMNMFGFSGGAIYQQIMASMIDKAPVINNTIAVSGFKSAFIFCLLTLIIALAFYSTQKEPGLISNKCVRH